jgi:hypothetical protein
MPTLVNSFLNGVQRQGKCWSNVSEKKGAASPRMVVFQDSLQYFWPTI